MTFDIDEDHEVILHELYGEEDYKRFREELPSIVGEYTRSQIVLIGSPFGSSFSDRHECVSELTASFHEMISSSLGLEQDEPEHEPTKGPTPLFGKDPNLVLGKNKKGKRKR